MPALNLRNISTRALELSNLLGRTSLRPRYEWTLRPAVTYAEREGVSLCGDLYMPRKSGTKASILVVHGGGWSGRTRDDMRFYSEQLAGQGYVVFNISYRLAPQHIFPSSVLDVRDAYRWLVQKAQELELDTTKIGGFGYSAGAHLLALNAAWASSRREHFQDVRFHTLALGGGVYDFLVYPYSPYINRFTTYYRDQNLELYREASPIHQLGHPLPHFFLFHSERDELVEWDQMRRFSKEILKRSGMVETYTVTNLNHAHTFVFGLKALEKAIDVFNFRMD
jgi:acetyl esterase/lipase